MLFSITLFNVNQFQAATALHLMNLNTFTFEISEFSFKYVNLVFHTINMATSSIPETKLLRLYGKKEALETQR